MASKDARADRFEPVHLQGGLPSDEAYGVLPMPWVTYNDALAERSGRFIGWVYSCTHLLTNGMSRLLGRLQMLMRMQACLRRHRLTMQQVVKGQGCSHTCLAAEYMCLTRGSFFMIHSPSCKARPPSHDPANAPVPCGADRSEAKARSWSELPGQVQDRNSLVCRGHHSRHSEM